MELDNDKFLKDMLNMKRELLKQSKSFFKLGILAFAVLYLVLIMSVIYFKNTSLLPNILSVIMVYVSMYFIRINILKTEYEIRKLERELEYKDGQL